MRRLSIALLSGLTLLCMLIAGLCLAILRTATNAQLYSAGFAACADTQAMNVPASQYDAIAQALSRYFAGKADTPQAQILKGGALASAFNEKELQHLSDVRRLFQSLRALGLILMIAVSALMLTACALAFCKRVELNGYRGGVYFNQRFGYEEFDLSQLQDYALWLAEYNLTPSFSYHFEVWQYSNDGMLSGVEGPVDRNLAFVEKTA